MDGYFVFDDINSADFKIWIKAGGTYGAAARRFTTEVVPGRNGSLTIDDGAYEEKEHPYECHIGDDFPENIEAFRNAIMSKVGRFVLSDSFHPGEYYQARYMRGLEPDVAALAKAGAFTLTFSRDPRRFLVDGDTPQDVSLTTETLSGSVVTFDNATGADRITGLSVSVNPVQSGSGDPSPTNIRPITGWTGANVWNDPKYGGTVVWNQFFLAAFTNTTSGVTFTRVDNYTVRIEGTASAVAYKQIGTTQTVLGHVYYTDSGTDNSAIGFYNDGKGVGSVQNRRRVGKATDNKPMYLRVANGATVDEIVKPQIFDLTRMFGEAKADEIYAMEQAQSGSGVAYFKSLFPRDYYPYNTGEETNVSAVNGDPYGLTEITWGDTVGTVYGGTLDVTNGVLTVTMAVVDLGTLTWGYLASSNLFSANVSGKKPGITGGVVSQYTNGGWWSGWANKDCVWCGNAANTGFVVKDTAYTDAATFKAAMSGVQFVYELAEPVTYQLTPTEITTLIGENNIWADCGDVSVTLQLPSTLINPTLFTAQPLIRVYGQGRVYIGSRSFTVSGSYPYIDINAELGDCTYNGINANSVVSFSGGYPELLPGENYITFSGVTKVEITPRWWRL